MTVEERRHGLDMQQIYKILHGRKKGRKETLFGMASNEERRTRKAMDAWNIRPQAVHLDIEKTSFIASRVSIESHSRRDFKGLETTPTFQDMVVQP